MSIRTELEALVDSAGLIHAETVVRWAQANPNSELHQKFPWDVEKAAWQYWLGVARRLISVYVVDQAGDRTTISLVSDRTTGGGYRDYDQVLSNDDMRYEACRQAVDELLVWRRRHEALTPELDTLFECIDRFRLPPRRRPARRPQPSRRPRRDGDQPSPAA